MNILKLAAVLFLATSAANAASPYFNVRTGASSGSSAALTSASTIGGSPTQIQYNLNGGFGGITGSSVDAAGNVSLTASLKVGLGTAANAAVQFNTNNVGLYNSGGSMRVTTAGDNTQFGSSFNNINKNTGINLGISSDPLVSLAVSGTVSATAALFTSNVSLTTGYVHMGSPTTPPTCNAANKGNVFMNTTTNCLNYCDGTANRQVTSSAATCT